MGNIYNWIVKKQYCDKAGIKYIHGVEAYVTETLNEKIRDNHHVVLLAKNYEGVKELNTMISGSFNLDHMYYQNRFTANEIISLSNNIIVLGGCLGGIFSRSSNQRLIDRIDYVEIQPHMCDEQKELNLRAINSGKKIVATGDFHYTSQYKKECTDILKASVSDSLVYEADWDLEFKNPTLFRQGFERLGYITKEQIDSAINSTIEIASSIEDFELDLSFKYPELYGNASALLHERVWAKFNSISLGEKDKEERIARINMELATMDKMGVHSFMLFMGEMTTYCKTNNIGVGPARGSAGASYVGYLLGITTIDPVKYKLEFSRFMNEERVSLMDIDLDFETQKRHLVFEYIKSRFDIKETSHIISFQKLKSKSIIDTICRKKNIDLSIATQIKAGHEAFDKEEYVLGKKLEDGAITQSEYDADMADVDSRLRDYLSRYKEVFYYYEGLKDAVKATSIHPAGMIAGNNDLTACLGVKFDKNKNHYVSMCDMKAVDSCNYVKYDILGLNTIDRIFNANRLQYNREFIFDATDDSDINVYSDLFKSPIGLFQFESQTAFSALKKFNPKSIEEIALVSAVLRPGCASFRDRILSRQFNANPDERIDKLLFDTYGYMVYQEQQIEFLKELCGFTAGQADLVRRAIGKKDEKLLASLIPKIKSGYIENATKSVEEATKDIEQYMQVFIDSAMYSFNKAHSVAYSVLTYACGYVRHHIKEAFIASFLNSSKSDEDIINGTKLSEVLLVKILPAKYGKARASYVISEGEVYKGLESIINLSAIFAEELFDISKTYKTDYFPDLIDIIYKESKAKNTTKIDTLIRVNYFSEFGKRKKLSTYYSLYQKYGKSKTINKEGLNLYIRALLDECGFTQTEKTYKVDAHKLMRAFWDKLRDQEFDENTILIDELSFLNYIESPISKKDKVGQVVWSGKTKKGNSVLLGNKWYGLAEGLALPKKGEYIAFDSTNYMMIGYTILELKRNKRG